MGKSAATVASPCNSGSLFFRIGAPQRWFRPWPRDAVDRVRPHRIMRRAALPAGAARAGRVEMRPPGGVPVPAAPADTVEAIIFWAGGPRGGMLCSGFPEPMKPTSTFILLVTASLIGPLCADTIRMKDGTKLEGKILKEGLDSYVMEVQVTRSIKEERTIKRTDVEKVDREQADDKAFAEIKGYVPTPDLLTADDYDARLTKVADFIKTNANSPLIPDAKKITADLEKERVVVAAGGVKLGGHLITNEERTSNKFEVDARMIEVSIRGRVKAGQWTAALREFEKLEKEYASSLGYREVLPAVRQTVAHYRSDATEALGTFDARMKERQAGLARMDASDRAASINAIAEQTAEITKQYEAEKKATIKWVTPNPNLKASLEEAIKYAEQEGKRLDAVKPDALPDGGKAWRDAWTAVHAGGDPKEAAAAIATARTAKMPERYIKELEAAAKAAGVK